MSVFEIRVAWSSACAEQVGNRKHHFHSFIWLEQSVSYTTGIRPDERGMRAITFCNTGFFQLHLVRKLARICREAKNESQGYESMFVARVDFMWYPIRKRI